MGKPVDRLQKLRVRGRMAGKEKGGLPENGNPPFGFHGRDQLTARTGVLGASQLASMNSSTSGRMRLRQLFPAKMP
ncbi:hypothetical protein MACH21_05580 [Roseicyclus marinus]|uniref:Uncharacterized protein n=1 Tax=Roseicyclus marinus TaxID=2161673 RepID=A0AA48HHP8_9RHOB|nr:hypothetical protein MACH21_05580 [Roseicyclus marinus]